MQLIMPPNPYAKSAKRIFSDSSQIDLISKWIAVNCRSVIINGLYLMIQNTTTNILAS